MNFDMDMMMNLVKMLGGGQNASNASSIGAGGGMMAMLPMLMSMMGGQNKAPSGGASRDADVKTQSARTERAAQSGNISPFAHVNGLGEISDFKEETEAPKSGSGQGNAMTEMLPMLMNMMSSKTAKTQSEEINKNDSEKDEARDESFEKYAKNPQFFRGKSKSSEIENETAAACAQKGTRPSPLSFAGAELNSAFEKLRFGK